MIEMLLTMALTGTAVTLLWLAVCRLLEERLSAPWRYRGLWLTMLFWLVPVKRCLTALSGILRPGNAVSVPMVLPETVYRPVLPVEPVATAPEVWSISRGAAVLLLALEGLGAAVLLTKRLLAYHRFRKRLTRAGISQTDAQARLLLFSCQQQVGIPGRVELYRCAAAPAPFVMGLFYPVIVLPEWEFTREELRCVLLHELTHVKQGDLWARRLALLVTALYWWDPVASLLERRLAELGEESCDARTAVPMDQRERYVYGLTLLKTACAEPMPSGMTLSFSTAKNVKRRLSQMLNAKKLTTKQKMLSLAAVVLLLAGGTVTALAAKAPVTVRETPEAAEPLVGTLVKTELPEVPVSDETPVKQVPAVALPEEEAPTVDTIPEPVPSTDSADTPEAKQAAPAATPEPVQTTATQPETGATEPERTIVAQRWEGRMEDSQLLYTDYSDGTREYSPYYQQQLDEARAELIAEGVLDENGQYFKNSKGETYCVNPGGLYGPAAILGEEPVYEAAQGTRGERGYLRISDTRFEAPTDAETCPHVWNLPLYDQEGNEIGVFEIGCGGHMNFSGMTVEEAKAALAEG